MLYLGIDQHHKQLTVSLRDEAGDAVLQRQVSTQPDQVRAFLEHLCQLGGEEGYVAIVEVCGFNDWLLDLLPGAGCRDVVLIHAEQRSRRKTDRRDAAKLSQLLWLNRERLRNGQKLEMRRVVIPSEQDRQDRQLTSLRKRVGQQKTRTINRIKNILRRHNLTWEQPTKTFQTRKVRQWLERVRLPEFDRFEMNQLLAQWDVCEKDLLEIEQRIAQRAAQNPKAQRLATAPGASAYSALAIASRIGDVERFPGPRSLANYFGLTPGCRNSGEQTDRLGSITKEGSAMVRFIVGQMVVHVLKRDRAMRTWYRGIRRRRGSKIARVAVMRRLVAIFWHMLRHDEAYAVGGPPRLKCRTARRAEVART